MRLHSLVLAGTAALFAVGVAGLMERFAPDPAADVARGTEEPFAEGLHRRELPPRQPPQRWSTETALFRFRDVPAGAAALEVQLRGQREPVTIAVDGVVVGTMPPGTTAARFPITDRVRGTREVRILAPAFSAADGRRLGALLERVSLKPSRSSRPSLRLVLIFLIPAMTAFAAARVSHLAPALALGLVLGLVLLEAAALWPGGVLRSGYGETLSGLLAGLAVAAALFARGAERGAVGRGPWAFAALVTAGLVQGLAATSPVMVVSDAVFHANKLAQVAAGDLFPTSVTQHASPFRFPYGVSFYALLAPLARAGVDEVALVRAGAALSGVAASGALFLLLAPYGVRRAGIAVLALQLMPGVFDVYSYGNLSNAFGQALTVMFFAWWAGRAPGGPVLGAVLLALGALAHFSSFVVVIALAGCLVAGRGGALKSDRSRLLAVALGLLLAAAYYGSFARLMAEQLPRLLEGGGRGFEGSRGVWPAMRQQVVAALSQWGVPAMVLAALGRPRASAGGLERDLAMYWLSGALLALPAVLSPLDVRYLYALTLPLAVAAATGFEALEGRGQAGRWLAWGLAAAQVVLASVSLAGAVYERYRP